MRKHSSFSRFYLKYIIKNSSFFYIFVFIGVSLFIYMSYSLRLNSLKSFPAIYENGRVTIEADLTEAIKQGVEKLYIYTDRNDMVFTVKIEGTSVNCGVTKFFIENKDIPDSLSLSKSLTAEVVTGSESLLKRIFVKAGKQG